MKAAALEEKDIYSGELILINSRHPLRGGGEEDLSGLCCVGGSVRLKAQCAAALGAALAAVSAQGQIVPVSGWRSEAEQRRIYSECLADDGEEFTRKFVALPGCSEHQTGLAIDLGEKRESIDFIRPEFPSSGICESFRQRAPEFGFIERYPRGAESITEIAYEPWHFRYVGYPHSVIMSGMGLTLEEYHEFLKGHAYGKKPFIFEGGGRRAEISYLAASESGRTRLNENEGAALSVSGNNMDGFIVSLWR